MLHSHVPSRCFDWSIYITPSLKACCGVYATGFEQVYLLYFVKYKQALVAIAFPLS